MQSRLKDQQYNLHQPSKQFGSPTMEQIIKVMYF